MPQEHPAPSSTYLICPSALSNNSQRKIATDTNIQNCTTAYSPRPSHTTFCRGAQSLIRRKRQESRWYSSSLAFQNAATLASSSPCSATGSASPQSTRFARSRNAGHTSSAHRVITQSTVLESIASTDFELRPEISMSISFITPIA